MPMSIDELTQLLILQKDHMESPNDATKEKGYVAFFDELMHSTPVASGDNFADPLFQNQPPIPFVEFRPTHPVTTPMPLIIHTHGGPHVYMDKKNERRHAELGYFLSHGYVVVCPNYRGSTDHPELDEAFMAKYPHFKREWKAWEESSKEKHHIYGPEDVYAVTQAMIRQPYIDSTKVFLRGGSYGSFINVSLLVGIQQGKFESLYKGVHLSGGVNYPPAALVPENVPILITHSTRDAVAPYADAKLFMEGLLLKQVARKKNQGTTTYLQTFVSHKGNHHMIDPSLSRDGLNLTAHMELKRYVQLFTSLFDSYRNHGPCYDLEPEVQLQRLVESEEKSKFTPTQLIELIRKRITRLREETTGATHVQSSDQSVSKEIKEEVEHRVNTYEISHTTQITPPNYYFVLLSTSTSVKTIREFYGPTMALLKLQLKDQFTGNVSVDLSRFLESHFSPISWSDKQKVIDAGKQILALPALVGQYADMIQREEHFLQNNPDYMVMYHAANEDTLHLYSFINVWIKSLRGESFSSLPIIEDTRLYEFVKNSFNDIDVFLKKMNKKATPDVLFNYRVGFQDRAMACNPSLISNVHNTASCSLWWYFECESTNRDTTPVETIVRSLLRLLGMESPERVARYLELFKRHVVRANKQPQALMQQIFIPRQAAEKLSYNCLIWGMEFGNNDLNLKSVRTLTELVHEPEKFEEKLRLNATAFTNHGNCPAFGQIQAGFNYASAIQVRYLPRYNPEVFTHSYFRAPEVHQAFISDLIALVREDYSVYLASTVQVPDYLVLGASHTSIARSRFFNTQKVSVNLESYYLTQKELYLGLVQNPGKEVYADISSLSKSDKLALQYRLKKEFQSVTRLSLFALCRFLKGYTYYELLNEAARATLYKGEVHSETYQWFLQTIDTFSVPCAIDTIYLCGNDYEKLQRLMNQVGQYRLNSGEHEFLHPEGPQSTDEDFWHLELNYAMQCILNIARLAKEKGYGHDVEARKEALFI